MKVKVIEKRPLVKQILRFYKDKAVNSLTLQVMEAAQPVYPILTAKDVAKWYDLPHRKAKEILEDLVHRGWMKRKGNKYCRNFGMTSDLF